MKLELNYYIVGMLLVAVILGTLVRGRCGNGTLVEGMLPFGNYRANTQYSDVVSAEEQREAEGKTERALDALGKLWDHKIPMNGGYKPFQYKKGSGYMGTDCAEAKKLASNQYVYIKLGDLYLNFDNEVGAGGAVYFSPEKPDGEPTADFQMKSIGGQSTVTVCKYKAQKWRFDMVDEGLDNCDVYISTTYAQDDKCSDIPFYLSVDAHGKLYGSMSKGSIAQRWSLIPAIVPGKYLLINPASAFSLNVGGSYMRAGSLVALGVRGRQAEFELIGKGTKQFNNWPTGTPPKFMHYRPNMDDPQGKNAGTSGWSGKFSEIWNGTYSGADNIVVKLDSDSNKGTVKIGNEKSYDVVLMGSNMLVSKGRNGRGGNGGIKFTGEMLSKEGELPRVRFFTIDGDGKYQNLSAKDSPDNMAAYSLYIANDKDYLASHGYGPYKMNSGLGMAAFA